MGKLYSKLGGKQRQKQLIDWKDGKGSLWNVEISEVEVNTVAKKEAVRRDSDQGGIHKEEET